MVAAVTDPETLLQPRGNITLLTLKHQAAADAAFAFAAVSQWVCWE